MSLMRINPFFEPWDVEKEMEKRYKQNQQALQGSFAPAMDVYQDDKHVHVELSIAGVKPDNIEIAIDESRILTISGKTERKTEIDEKNFIKKEIHYGTFLQRVPLPSQVKSEKAKATYDQGVLKIKIPRETTKAGRVVKVKIDKPKNKKK